MFPTEKIVADRMSPVHSAPIGSIRIKLIKQMILPFIIDQSVGVVHPAAFRHKMVPLPLARVLTDQIFIPVSYTHLTFPIKAHFPPSFAIIASKLARAPPGLQL